MKTRAQRQKEGEEELKKKVSAKKSKKQILMEQVAKKKEAAGKAEGKKKIKKEKTPEKETSKPKKGKSKATKEKSKSPERNTLSRRDSLRKRPSASEVIKKASPQKKESQKPEPVKQKAKKGKKSEGSKQQAKKSKDQEEEKEDIKKITFKGKVPIDEHCRYAKDTGYQILEHGGKIYSATLNQTSVQNNNNKFYILQIIQNSSNSNQCYFFTRWGRVGVQGQIGLEGPYQQAVAIACYNRKYHEKHNKGNYRQVQLNYENEDEKKSQKKSQTKANENQSKKDFDQSKLSKPVKRLIELIFDLNMMNKQMVEIGYNISKMPLGKLSKDNIKNGYGILQKLMDELKGKARSVMIAEFTNDFYSIIPHDFGFAKMSNFILDTEVKVKKKIEMLEALAEIKVATTLLSNSQQDSNKIDSNYKKLNRQIESVDPQSQLFNVINKFLQTTHATTHSSYTLQLQDLFQLSSEVQNVRYTSHIDNKTLLWHGSRLTNFVGILSQGLRIAPPQAPVTGYMFGKGVYFADMSSKSANYCFTNRDNNTGILLLCEVALGNMNEKLQADYYASNLPPGKNSTKGVGRTAPNPSNAVKLSDGVVIPMGPGENTNVPGCSLMYNQFIVYDIAQIKVRYLLRTKFNYKGGFW